MMSTSPPAVVNYYIIFFSLIENHSSFTTIYGNVIEVMKDPNIISKIFVVAVLIYFSLVP